MTIPFIRDEYEEKQLGNLGYYITRNLIIYAGHLVPMVKLFLWYGGMEV
jgi:hypothetical protein